LSKFIKVCFCLLGPSEGGTLTSTNTWRWVNVRPIAAYWFTQRSAWPTSWWPPGTDRHSLRGPKVNAHMASRRRW